MTIECPTGKRVYQSWNEAQRDTRFRQPQAARTLTPYRCELCHLYHLAGKGSGGRRR